MERISVIITSFEQKDLLRQALDSVLAQSRPADEIIVCDDASTDGSPELIKSYQARHPQLIRAMLHQNNTKIARNRNSGLRAATGSLIAWLDGDDIYLPEKLAQEEALLAASPAAGFCYSQVTTWLAANNESYPRYDQPPEGDIFAEVIFMLGHAPRNPLVRKSALERCGLFNEEMELYEDFDLMVRLARLFPCRYCPQPGMIYRVHGGGLHKSAVRRHQENILRLRENILRLLQDRPEPERRRAAAFFTEKSHAIGAAAAPSAPARPAGAATRIKRLWQRLTGNPA